MPTRCAARATRRPRSAPIVVAFPELFIAGYPPEDLVLKPAFQAACRAAVEALARESTSGPALLVGTPWVEDGKLYNAYVLLAGGAIEARALSRSICRTTACSTRSACSRRARCRGRS